MPKRTADSTESASDQTATEEATELSNYLPLSFKSPKEQEYIEFLWDVFEQSSIHAKARMGHLFFLPVQWKILNITFLKRSALVYGCGRFAFRLSSADLDKLE